jgi:catechol 1,2-dioxygenase
MIIENQASVTTAVLEAFGRTSDPRLREILLSLAASARVHPRG